MKTITEQLNIKEFPFGIIDKNYNIIYKEYDDKYWCKYEYDSNGWEIYYESSDGFWCKTEYDSNGKETYYESSKGLWSKYEYDSNLNEIYHETNEGVILDKRVKELTLDQIAEKFGIEVSQLKIKK